MAHFHRTTLCRTVQVSARACNRVRAFACVRCMRGAQHRRLDVITISSPNPMRTPKRTVVITARVTNHRPPRLSPLLAAAGGPLSGRNVHARTGTRTHLRMRTHAQHSRDRAGWETRAARRTWAKWDRAGTERWAPPVGSFVRICAQVHPGESPASFVCQGAVLPPQDLRPYRQLQSPITNAQLWQGSSSFSSPTTRWRAPCALDSSSRSRHGVSHRPPFSSRVALATTPARPPARHEYSSTPLPPARPRGRFHVGACAFRAASVD